MNYWEKNKSIRILGFRTDIADIFAKSNLIVLPSYYGEGLPKVLIEAVACGRSIVTTDHPGCRDAVVADKTGRIVPVRNAIALAEAIQQLIENNQLRKSMGEAGRQLAEKKFSVEKVKSAHLEIYQELMSSC